MKFYSDITEKMYETKEELEKAESEAAVQAQAQTPVTKESKAVSERKMAADKVSKVFADVSAARKVSAEKRKELGIQQEALDKKYKDRQREIAQQYEKEKRTLDDTYSTKAAAIESEYEAESQKLGKALIKLDEEDKKGLNAAYKELFDFNKKYGKYHYSVDSEGAELFPLLFGFGQIERTGNVLESLFNSFFNLF